MRVVDWPGLQRIRLIRNGPDVELAAAESTGFGTSFYVAPLSTESRPRRDPVHAWPPSAMGSPERWDAARLKDGRLVLTLPIQPAVLFYAVGGVRKRADLSRASRPRLIKGPTFHGFHPLSAIFDASVLAIVDDILPARRRDVASASGLADALPLQDEAGISAICLSEQGRLELRRFDPQFRETARRVLADASVREFDACWSGQGHVAIAALVGETLRLWAGEEKEEEERKIEVGAAASSPAVCADASGQLRVACLQSPGHAAVVS